MKNFFKILYKILTIIVLCGIISVFFVPTNAKVDYRHILARMLDRSYTDIFSVERDLESPKITIEKTYDVKQNTTLDLDTLYTVYDNSNDTVTVTYSGECDFKTVGKYPLTYTATDRYGNTSTAKTTISVYAPVTIAKALKTTSTISRLTKANKKYHIVIYREDCVTVIYSLDAAGNYDKAVKVFICSPGADENTELGTFKITEKYRWHELLGPSWGQYCCRFNGHILFHSVPYEEEDNSTLKYWLYNKLGTKDSMGCVRLTTANAKWIYDNCEIGTIVSVVADPLPNELKKPKAQQISYSDKNRGWDPTDPDENNPWKKITTKTDSTPTSDSKSEYESSTVSKSESNFVSSMTDSSTNETSSITTSTEE